MTLQSKNLAMVGLGVTEHNFSPNPAQPPLVPGIHLRWAFEPAKGFPLYGFYLFRRAYEQDVVFMPTVKSGLDYVDSTTLKVSLGIFKGDHDISLTDSFDPPGQSEIDLDGQSLLFIPNQPIIQANVTIGLEDVIPDASPITVTAWMGNVSVAQISVSGPKQVVTRSLAFDNITSIEFSGGKAALIELEICPLASVTPWQQIPGFHYPLSLPLTHPDYPSTPGGAENLGDARAVARTRILYGNPDQFTAAPKLLYGDGNVSVVHNSPIVQGQGTKWGQNLVGAVLQVNSDPTAYTILSVIGETKIVLSREYAGASASSKTYAIRDEPFGQLYDNLVHLVQKGPAFTPVSMAERWLPQTIYRQGTISVQENSATVTGLGTSWGTELEGLSIQIMTFGNPVGYTIISVDSMTQLTIEPAYPAPSASGLLYEIIPSSGQKVPGALAPRLPRQSPLQLILLGALHPAVAQMLGLYWVDDSATENTVYDYLLVAAHQPLPTKDALNWLLSPQDPYPRRLDSPDVDAYILFNQKKEVVQPLDAPSNLEAYALPSGGFSDVYAAGLRWDLGINDQNELLADKPILYHIWRANLGAIELTTAPDPNNYKLLTENRPVLLDNPDHPRTEIPRRLDWPPSRLYFIDTVISEGWYSYKVNSIDIFGRYSLNSDPFPWHKWTPPPTPLPWYWNRTASNEVNHFAVGLLDKTPPPPPTDVKAFALDPADPWLMKDAAYTGWWQDLITSSWYQALTAEQKQDLVPLRVRWLWSEAEMMKAPDVHEFRIYFQPDPLNALPGHVTKISPVSGQNDESLVETDVPNSQVANAYYGAELRIGDHSFRIQENDASSPLKFRVKSGPVITEGTAKVTDGSMEVIGSNTQWTKSLAGLSFTVKGEQTEYRILDVDPNSQKLSINTYYHGQSAPDKAYMISGKLPAANQPCTVVMPSGDSQIPAHPLFKNFSDPTSWQDRYAVVAYDSHFVNSLRPAQDAMGRVLRGDNSTVAGKVVTLKNVTIDISKFDPKLPLGLDLNDPLFTLWLFLENDASSGKIYRVLDIEVDSQPNTINVTVDTSQGNPNLNVSPSVWALGHPVRRYEVFLPSASDSYHEGLPLNPTLSEPIVYANIGVSAADDKDHTDDNSKWTTGRWGGRKGNEGLVSAPAVIFRVLRKTPDTPQIPTFTTDKVYATAADYHNRSYYTVRWQKPANGLKTHLFRALDATLYEVDWLIRSTRKALSTTDHADIFPDWDTSRRQAAANQLNAITSKTSYATLSPDARELLARLPGNVGVKDSTELDKRDWEIRRTRTTLDPDKLDDQEKYIPPEWRTEPMKPKREAAVAKLNAIASRDAYENLGDTGDDARRILANLPGNEAAFSQLTIEPLDPTNYPNRIGPDNPSDFVIDPGLCAYIDILDGRSINGYLYRSANVDGAHNLSSLSLSSPPVYCPDIVPPRAPVITKIFAGDPDPALPGDRKITLQWTSNREPDLKEYRVYRADNKTAIRDIRLMSLVHTETESRAPGSRLAEIIWTDTSALGLVTYYYCVVAIDKEGNISQPSLHVAAQSFDEIPPSPPTWDRIEWVQLDVRELEHPINDVPPTGAVWRKVVALAWATPTRNRCLVQRRRMEQAAWETCSRWLQPTSFDNTRSMWLYRTYDTKADPLSTLIYRIKVESLTGILNTTFDESALNTP